MKLLMSILSNLVQLRNAYRLVVSYISKREILMSKNISTGFLENDCNDFDENHELAEFWPVSLLQIRNIHFKAVHHLCTDRKILQKQVKKE